MPYAPLRAPAARMARGTATAALWDALRAAGRPATIRELHMASGVHPNAAQQRLRRWVRAGFADEVPSCTPKRFVMSDDAPPVPPTVNAAGRAGPKRTCNERIWTAMRVCKSFDVPTLQMSAQASRRAVETYINALARAGIIRMARRGNPMRGDWSTYHLVRSSGPKAPKVSWSVIEGERRRAVIDPNNGRVHDISPAAVSLRQSRQAAPAPNSLRGNHVC